MIAAWLARRLWAKRSESGPLIHCELPLRVARRPSRVWA